MELLVVTIKCLSFSFVLLNTALILRGNYGAVNFTVTCSFFETSSTSTASATISTTSETSTSSTTTPGATVCTLFRVIFCTFVEKQVLAVHFCLSFVADASLHL